MATLSTESDERVIFKLPPKLQHSTNSLSSPSRKRKEIGLKKATSDNLTKFNGRGGSQSTRRRDTIKKLLSHDKQEQKMATSLALENYEAGDSVRHTPTSTASTKVTKVKHKTKPETTCIARDIDKRTHAEIDESPTKEICTVGEREEMEAENCRLVEKLTRLRRENMEKTIQIDSLSKRFGKLTESIVSTRAKLPQMRQVGN